MTVQTENPGKNVEHDQEKSVMAAAQEPRVEELVGGVQVPPLPPDVERILSTSSMTEWCDLLRASFGTELSQLHWDILSFCKAYELTDQQMQLRRDALDCVKRAVRDIWPSADVNLFGSTAIGLALPWSDIDVVIVPPKQQNLTSRKPTPMAWQNALSLKLNQLGQCLSLRSLPFAKVPILKVVLKSGIACDISFDAWGTEASVSVIRQFMKQHEPCRPLCLVLKFFLGQNNLNELHTGGLGSFCIFTMVISHLQKMASFAAAEFDLGTLLLSFFARYSNMHNYCTDVVSTRADSRSSKLEKGWVNLKHPQLLAVEDPLDPTSDIAKGSHKIEEVRKKFAHAQRTLLTHWYDEQVLAEIVDMTANPNQRPEACSPKKAKRSKKRRAVASQDDHILPYQPALKIQRIHHPPQGSGVVTKRQLDWILAKHKAPQLSSLPISKRLRTGGDDELEKDRSVQKIAPKTPSPHGTELCKRSQNHVTLETEKSGSNQPPALGEGCCPVHTVHSKPAKECSGAAMNNSMPRLCKLFSSDDPKMAAKQPSTQDDDVKSAVDLDFWEAQLTSRRKARCGSSIHQSRKDVGKNVEPAEAIHLNFGEAQLTTRQKSRSGSLIHQSSKDEGKNMQPAGEAILLDFWEALLTPRRKSRSGAPIHQSRKDVGKDAEPAEVIHLDFGEAQLATRQKSKSDSLIHQSSKDVEKNVQPADAIHLDFWEAQLTPRRKSRSGSSINQSRKNVGENVEPAEAIHLDFGEAQLATRQKSKSDSLIHQSSKDVEKNVQPADAIHLDFWEAQLTPRRKSRSGSSIHQYKKNVGENVEPAEAIHLDFGETQLASRRKFGSGSSIHQSTKDVGKNVQPAEAIHFDFWEAQLTTRRKSRSGSVIRQNTKDLGSNVQPTAAIHPEQSTQGQHVVDVVQDNKRILIDASDPDLTPKPTSRVGSFPEDGLERQIGHPAGNVQEELSIDFWEAHLAPRLKSQKRAGSNQHSTSGEAVEDPQSSSMDVVSVEANGGALPIQSSDLYRPQDTGKNATGRSGDEKLLVDFWEALFCPKLKARGCLSKHLAAGSDEGAQPVEKDHPEQRQPPRSIEERVSSDERKLVDFWETQLIPKPKSRMGCLNNNRQADGEQAEKRTGAVGSNGEGFDRILVDFWEANLTPSLKSSRRGSLQHDTIAGEENKQPFQKTLSTQGRSFVGRSEDESMLSTFWEKCLNPAFSRKGCRRRKSVEVIY